MKQLTPKTVEEALQWIETNQHHYAAVDDEPGFFILKGYGAKLRIPNALQRQMTDLVGPSPHSHDDRMYRATNAGRKVIGLPKQSSREADRLFRKLVEAEALIRELCAHEGAEGHSVSLVNRLEAYQFETKEKDHD